ncbi:hypothetical protein BC835DRAFT_51438 [Cytidiella melzeri]|nr:hypothetical protein BC835DRAFT_51438 [Cytidiella melzeri]
MKRSPLDASAYATLLIFDSVRQATPMLRSIPLDHTVSSTNPSIGYLTSEDLTNACIASHSTVIKPHTSVQTNTHYLNLLHLYTGMNNLCRFLFSALLCVHREWRMCLPKVMRILWLVVRRVLNGDACPRPIDYAHLPCVTTTTNNNSWRGRVFRAALAVIPLRNSVSRRSFSCVRDSISLFLRLRW